MIRVLLVDDDKLARKGLISIMPWSSYDMEVVGEAANGAKALEFLAGNEVDLMFVDLAMPVLSGIELIQEACRCYPRLHFVVLTFHEDFEYIQTAFRLGALDYISKVRLEIEDYEQIFDRIRKSFLRKLQETGQTSDRPLKNDIPVGCVSVEETTSGLQWCELEQEWRSLYWLYDEACFQRLCKATLELKPPIRLLERLLLRVLSPVETATGVSVEGWSDTDSIQSAVLWLHHYRDTLYKKADQTTELTETSLCILKSILYIRGHIANGLHAEAAATHVNMSRSYFCQCFKKLTGLTFNDYVRQIRVRTAMELITRTSQTITWIANAVGYGDVKYFSHIFHEQTEMLPSEYRAQYNRGDK